MKQHIQPESNPAILYFGTPVVLVGTTNEDRSFNLAPISSVFWLGWRCVIGIAAASKTTENILRTGECVLNLPSVRQVDKVDRLALLTGTNPVPEGKQKRGYRYERDKFGVSGFTPAAAVLVNAPAAAECPVQMEARLRSAHPVGEDDPVFKGRILSLELEVVRVGIDEDIRVDGEPDRVDPDKWRPLIMSFQHFYGLGEKVHASALAGIPERLYRPNAVPSPVCPSTSPRLTPGVTGIATM